MTERIHNITRAVCRQADGSRTDGWRMVQLTSPVMGFDVNLAAIDHSDVASDTDRFTARLFLTDYCEALSRVLNCKGNFHNIEIFKSENKERLEIEYAIRLDKNRTPIQNESNVLLYLEHESLPPLDLKSPYEDKVTNIFD